MALRAQLLWRRGGRWLVVDAGEENWPILQALGGWRTFRHHQTGVDQREQNLAIRNLVITWHGGTPCMQTYR